MAVALAKGQHVGSMSAWVSSKGQACAVTQLRESCAQQTLLDLNFTAERVERLINSTKVIEV